MSRHSSHHRVRIKLLKKKQQKEYVRKAVLATAVIEPLMTIPQIYDIWHTKNAAGVSRLTWIMYVSAAVVWLLYGIQLKDKPIIISSILWVLTESAVVIGIFMYS